MSIEQEMVRYDRVRHIHIQISKVNLLNENAHGSFELSYILDGWGHYYAGQQKIDLQPGSLTLSNPYEPHSHVSRTEKPLVVLTLQIHRLFLRRYIDCVPKQVFNCAQISQLTQAQRDVLLNLLVQTAVAYLNEDGAQQFNVIGAATLLLGKLKSFLEWKLESNPDSADKELQKERMRRLVSYIDENYRQKITLSMLADMEGISTTYLSHFFRKAFGVSFQTYLSTQRLEKALVLMHDKNTTMVDICMSCGFSDSRYLEAACRKMFGCSVSEYRKRSAQQEEFGASSGGSEMHGHCGRKESREIMKTYLGADVFERYA